jgi:hypothetical protein
VKLFSCAVIALFLAGVWAKGEGLLDAVPPDAIKLLGGILLLACLGIPMGIKAGIFGAFGSLGQRRRPQYPPQGMPMGSFPSEIPISQKEAAAFRRHQK